MYLSEGKAAVGFEVGTLFFPSGALHIYSSLSTLHSPPLRSLLFCGNNGWWIAHRVPSLVRIVLSGESTCPLPVSVPNRVACLQFYCFLIFHLWNYDRFKCLRWSEASRRPGAFKRIMTVSSIPPRLRPYENPQPSPSTLT